MSAAKLLTELNEQEITETLVGQLRKYIDVNQYEVDCKTDVLYTLNVTDPDINVVDLSNRKRGQGAFEVDILISKRGQNKLPLVVIELKSGGLTTHDLLTYGAKAQRHRLLYPFLRYGLLTTKHSHIARRFFVHGTEFDFYFTANKWPSEMIAEFCRFIVA